MGFVFALALALDVATVALAVHGLGWLWSLSALALAAGVGIGVLAGRGMDPLRRATKRLSQGHGIGRSLIDAGLYAMAGALLLWPGFLSDLFAVPLLYGPVRAYVSRKFLAFLEARISHIGFVNPFESDDVHDEGMEGMDKVIDTTATEVATKVSTDVTTAAPSSLPPREPS
jgi:UPF0716 protein FxsA